MPYLILFFGLLIGLYAFMRYFTRAEVNDIRTMFAWMGFAILALALLFLAVMGRVIPAIIILVLLLPFALAHIKAQIRPFKKKNMGRRASDHNDIIDGEVTEVSENSANINGRKAQKISDKRKRKSDDNRRS